MAAKTANANPDFGSIAGAAAYVHRRVHVPAVVPRGLPDGTRLSTHPVIVSDRKGEAPSAQIHLLLPGGRGLTLEYGIGGFDGCGPLHPREVRVRGYPAVLDVERSGGRMSSTVVWPATLHDLSGRYAVAGEIDPARALALADAMAKPPPGQPSQRAGC